MQKTDYYLKALRDDWAVPLQRLGLVSAMQERECKWFTGPHVKTPQRPVGVTSETGQGREGSGAVTLRIFSEANFPPFANDVAYSLGDVWLLADRVNLIPPATNAAYERNYVLLADEERAKAYQERIKARIHSAIAVVDKEFSIPELPATDHSYITTRMNEEMTLVAHSAIVLAQARLTDAQDARRAQALRQADQLEETAKELRIQWQEGN